MTTIDKIRAEIERRREANKRQYHSSAGGTSWQRMCGEEDCLVELLAFLDTLEPVSDDLEDEMDRYFESMEVQEHENIFEDTFHRIAKHFAEWGAEHLANRNP